MHHYELLRTITNYYELSLVTATYLCWISLLLTRKAPYLYVHASADLGVLRNVQHMHAHPVPWRHYIAHHALMASNDS